MKKTIVIAAIFIIGLGISAPQVFAKISFQEIHFQQEKIKIKPDDLPVPVKTKITGDALVGALPLLESYKITQPQGKFIYEVVFDGGAEMRITKKYNEKGEEV